MKKALSLLLAVCMIITALPMAVFAEDAADTSSYKAGDLVWSYDFESVSGSLLGNAPEGFTFSNNSGASVLKADVVENAGNKYLHHTTDRTGTTGGYSQYMQIAVPDEAKDEDGYFTFEVDMKLEKFNAETMSAVDSANASLMKYTEYNVGLYNVQGGNRAAYFTMNPKAAADNGNSNGFALNGDRIPSNVKQKVWLNGNTYDQIWRPYAWNNYRFVVRKQQNADTGADEYFADLYLNGVYFYRIGQRNTTANFATFTMAMVMNAGITHAGYYLDNPRFYYGVTEADGAVSAKGAFKLDNFDFNDKPAYTYAATDGSTTYASGYPYIQGEDVDHVMGTIRRYNAWNMTLDIQKGKHGKAAEDSSLSVTGNGRINFDRQVTESTSNATTYSTPHGTMLAEGDTLEIATDVLFTDTSKAFTLQTYLHGDGGSDRLAIQVTPNYYGHGHWQDADDFQNHRTEISPGLPLNKWIRLKLFITRGTSTSYNKYSIYADNIAIVENADLAYWYSDESFPDKAISDTPVSVKGEALKTGFSKIYFHGNANYDNITFGRYLGGATYSVDSNIPVIMGKDNPEGTMPSIRGKVFPGTCTLAEIISQFGLDTDEAVASYVVRDESGNTVTDYTQAAGGKYIDITTAGGEHMYATLSADKYLQNVTEVTDGAFGNFTLHDGAITAENVAAGYGRAASDNSIKITNTDTANPDRVVKYTPNSYDNSVFELSFLADENTNFNMGYDVLYIIDGGNTDARKNNTGSARGYAQILTIKDGIITGHRNPSATVFNIGTYNVGEWTKLRLRFDNAEKYGWVSINDGPEVKLDNGPGGYIYKIRDIYITLPAGGSQIIDDIRFMEGARVPATAPAITAIDSEELFVKGNSIIATDGLLGGFVDMAFDDAITVNPAASIVRYIDANGALVTDDSKDDTIAKYVLTNNDTYTYYNVGFYNFDCITVDGTTAKVELISKDIANVSNAKLITAVYAGESGALKDASITDLSFAADAAGVPVATVSDYAEPASADGDMVTYYVWNMNTLMPLCKSVDK
ncbi:MAG: hypothetical protein IJ460_00235 [Clostridia bacterium]|nr:hypothetical protein [Clostridia bacterium]